MHAWFYFGMKRNWQIVVLGVWDLYCRCFVFWHELNHTMKLAYSCHLPVDVVKSRPFHLLNNSLLLILILHYSCINLHDQLSWLKLAQFAWINYGFGTLVDEYLLAKQCEKTVFHKFCIILAKFHPIKHNWILFMPVC